MSEVAPAVKSWALPNLTTSVPPEKPLPLISTKERSFDEPNIGLKELMFWPEARDALKSPMITGKQNRGETLIFCWVSNQWANQQGATIALSMVYQLT